MEPKLVIEVDGGQHAEPALQDARRTEYLKALGYRVIRFWNDEVLRELDAVLAEIGRVLIEIPSPYPLPEGEGRIEMALPEGEGRKRGAFRGGRNKRQRLSRRKRQRKRRISRRERERESEREPSAFGREGKPTDGTHELFGRVRFVYRYYTAL